MANLTADQTRELKKSLERALDILHDINTKLYIAEACNGPLSEVDKKIEDALRAGHAAHELMGV